MIDALYGLKTHDWFGHANATFYEALLGPRRFSEFHKFAVLRNPAERCRSAFYFAQQGGFGLATDDALKKLIEEMGFDAFVASDRMHDALSNFVIFRPQWSFICAADGSVMLDSVCRLETLEHDLKHMLSGRINIDTIPAKNQSTYMKTAKITPETLARLKILYAKDYNLLHQLKQSTVPQNAHVLK